MVKQLPIRVRAGQKTDVRGQFGALCYRIKGGKMRLLLITSRNRGRWIIPKGWPVDRLTPAAAAAEEAWEEAGAKGEASNRCLGVYSYVKQRGPVRGKPCMVMVYPLQVRSLASDYPEKGQRRRKWFSPKKAAKKVNEPELSRIMREFSPVKKR